MRLAPRIELSAEQRKALEDWASGRKTTVRVAEPARFVLLTPRKTESGDRHNPLDLHAKGRPRAPPVSRKRPLWPGVGRPAPRAFTLHRSG